ncbi:Mbeg1-like protein [Beduini massiliensis]|uniref:Mbeg1-like protein n=1 Tax=Beduini massiliensis TaxID=1585974 RepID=UPI00059A9C0C|nr:Mbeg1-like protein [Beduini massiliensis]
MENILTYLKWRGDLLFKEKAFNKIDSLIFALLSYIEWGEIIKETSVSLPTACLDYCERYDQEHFNKTYSFSPLLSELIHVLPTVLRYREVKLSRYQVVNDKQKEVQFGALCIELAENIVYVSYRGTDISILGWKEDLDMTYLDVIPSQHLAENYLKEIGHQLFKPKKWWKFRDKMPDLYIGGHSKGGNLAMYAAICCDELSPWIKGVYSFDGPGFRKIFYEQHNPSFISDRLHHYIPEASIFGRVLEHCQDPTIIKGYSEGLMQHDAFYWEVDKDHFVYKDTLSKESDQIKLYLDQVLINKSDEEKKTFITLLYKMLDEMKIESINDFTAVGFRQWIRGIKELSMMSKEEYKMFYELLKLMFMQSKSFLYDLIKR